MREGSKEGNLLADTAGNNQRQQPENHENGDLGNAQQSLAGSLGIDALLVDVVGHGTGHNEHHAVQGGHGRSGHAGQHEALGPLRQEAGNHDRENGILRTQELIAVNSTGDGAVGVGGEEDEHQQEGYDDDAGLDDPLITHGEALLYKLGQAPGSKTVHEGDTDQLVPAQGARRIHQNGIDGLQVGDHVLKAANMDQGCDKHEGGTEAHQECLEEVGDGTGHEAAHHCVKRGNAQDQVNTVCEGEASNGGDHVGRALHNADEIGEQEHHHEATQHCRGNLAQVTCLQVAGHCYHTKLFRCFGKSRE